MIWVINFVGKFIPCDIVYECSNFLLISFCAFVDEINVNKIFLHIKKGCEGFYVYVINFKCDQRGSLTIMIPELKKKTIMIYLCL